MAAVPDESNAKLLTVHACKVGAQGVWLIFKMYRV